MGVRKENRWFYAMVLAFVLFAVYVIYIGSRGLEREDSVTIIDGDTTAISVSRLMNIQDSLDYLEHQSETEINSNY